MAVKMRLMRMGKTKSPHYRVVVIDGRAPRDGRYIDLIGRYDPRQDPSIMEIDAEKAVEWLRKGAQPTEAVSKILEASGALTRFKVEAGRIHTVGDAPAPAAPSPEEKVPAATAEDDADEQVAGEADADAEGDRAGAEDEAADAASEEE